MGVFKEDQGCGAAPASLADGLARAWAHELRHSAALLSPWELESAYQWMRPQFFVAVLGYC